MLRITDNLIKKQKRFWNAAVFHPTDAVEDPWGKRILDRMIVDGAVDTVRIYSMFEDIVYLDDDGSLCYDFRLSDLRLDYLTSMGYKLMVAYAGIPDCIAKSTEYKTKNAKNKTRYKGKMWNSAPPKDPSLWEEVCYEYTKHNVERYGIEVVSSWKCSCFNEPDAKAFFLSNLDRECVTDRITEYSKMYDAFARGVRRVSNSIPIGGPALAGIPEFLEGFLRHVKDECIPMDFISLHGYGTSPKRLNENTRPFSVGDLMDKYRGYFAIIRKYGFEDIPILIDEWGMSSSGYLNREECPSLMARENELISAYFTKLISELTYSELKLEMLAICLSGQHEMVEDFSGFRNFFTLNMIKKPIYNAHILASRLADNILEYKTDNPNINAVATKDDSGSYYVMLSYSSVNFKEDIPEITERILVDRDISGRRVTVWCIDKTHTNPYRVFLGMNKDTPDPDDLELLRKVGNLEPISVSDGSAPIELKLTPNSTYFVAIES